MDIDIENRKSHIYIKVSGQTSLGVSDWGKINSARTSVVKTVKENDIYKLLFDCRILTAKISTVDRFLIAAFLAQENLFFVTAKKLPLKIAFVANQSLLDIDRFGEKVANNRGLYGLLTTDIQEAFTWLDLNDLLKEEISSS
jgi:hypothetical protein